MRVEIELHGNTMMLEYQPSKPVRLQDMLCMFEREILKHMIEQKKGIKARAAEALSLLRTTLVEKAKKYEII